jgi:hypothetical protein
LGRAEAAALVLEEHQADQQIGGIRQTAQPGVGPLEVGEIQLSDQEIDLTCQMIGRESLIDVQP